MRKDIDRISAASKNLKTSVAGIFFGFLFSFVSRRVFILVLGREYVGFGSLAGNISALMTLLDFGASGAVIYRLYEPLAKKDYKTVSEYLGFFARLSKISALLIFASGMLLLPRIPDIADNFSDTATLYSAFFLYIFSLSASYFFVRERILLFADQKNYINSLFGYASAALGVIVESVVLLVFKNYVIYIATHCVVSITEDFCVRHFVRKSYPEIDFHIKRGISAKTKKELFLEMLFLQPKEICATLLRTVDNFLVVGLFGVAANGLYSNYNMLLSYASMVSVSLIGTVSASVGNLNVMASEKNSERVFGMTDFLSFFLVNICTCILFVLSGDIIVLWLGKSLVLEKSVSAVLAVNFFISATRTPVAIFRDARGLYKKEKLKPFAELCATLIFSVYLGKRFGIPGIYAGQALSAFIVCWWYEPYILFKYGFSRSPFDYYLKRISYAAVVAISCFLALGLCENVTRFSLRLAVCIALPSAVCLIVFCFSKDFKNLVATAKKALFLHK